VAHLTTAPAESESKPTWVPVAIYCRTYHLSETTVRRWVRFNLIRHIRLGKTLRVDLNDTRGGDAA
jgi:hypothetical protein